MQADTVISILAVLRWPAIGIRAGVVAVSLVLWFWTQSLIGRKAAPKGGIGDVVHDLTARWNRYFSTHDRAANAALIISSIFIDLFGLSLIGAAVFGSTFAPFLAILFLFAMRQLCQALHPAAAARHDLEKSGVPRAACHILGGQRLLLLRPHRGGRARSR